MSARDDVHMRSWLLETLTLCGVRVRAPGIRVTAEATEVSCQACLRELRKMKEEESDD